MTVTAVMKPRPGTGRPKARSYMGPKMSSMRLQKIHRIHAVATAGMVTKNPVIIRTLSQFLIPERSMMRQS